MEFSFKYEALNLDVTIEVTATDRDGGYDWTFVSICEGPSGPERSFESLPSGDQAAVETLCDKWAYEKSGEAYEEYCQGCADWEYECMKDDLSERGES